VVLPARNEGDTIARALDSTRAPGVDRIVVDGGSLDGTPDLAVRLGAERVLESAPGRARQLEVGLRAAQGDLVLLLHADTRLEPGWESALRRALRDDSVAGGAFQLAFESQRSVYRVIESGARLRARWLGLPYGDQGLFARRKPLLESGGIPQVPIFEDLDLTRLLRRLGRLVLLPERAWTSPRRYERNGVLRTLLRNNLALTAWLLDLDRERIARWYRASPRR
jgi:rSAM/selenodomain-associated transferase 2